MRKDMQKQFERVDAQFESVDGRFASIDERLTIVEGNPRSLVIATH